MEKRDKSVNHPTAWPEDLRRMITTSFDEREVVERPMFGYPGFFLRSGKLFACLREDGVALRIPPEDSGLRRFSPGRPMRGWSFLELEQIERVDLRLLFERAIESAELSE